MSHELIKEVTTKVVEQLLSLPIDHNPLEASDDLRVRAAYLYLHGEFNTGEGDFDFDTEVAVVHAFADMQGRDEDHALDLVRDRAVQLFGFGDPVPLLEFSRCVEGLIEYWMENVDSIPFNREYARRVIAANVLALANPEATTASHAPVIEEAA